MQFNDAALGRTNRGGGGQGAPTPPNNTGSRGTPSPWTQRLRRNQGGQRRQHGSGNGTDITQLHADIAAKLPGIGKKAVANITSCNADKSLRVLKEISKYIGSNIQDVYHQVQLVFTSGVHYYWTATRLPDPRKLQVKSENDLGGDLVTINPNLVDSWDIISYEVTARNHALKKIKYTDACVKVYSWMWTLCT